MNSSVPGFKFTVESTTIAMCGDEATMTAIQEEEEEEEEDEEEEGEYGVTGEVTESAACVSPCVRALYALLTPASPPVPNPSMSE